MDLVVKIYALTKDFPEDEIYGLTGQIRRVVISIPSNVAEGSGRKSDKEFVRFLSIALGSSTELETQLLISARLKYLKKSNDLLAESTVIRKMLISLIKAVNGQ